MKLARYALNGAIRIGRIDQAEATIVPIAGVSDMVDAIERIDDIGGVAAGDAPAHSLADVRLLAPIPAPLRNIFCVGKNYREHAREFSNSGYEAGAVKGAEIDSHPAVFTKPQVPWWDRTMSSNCMRTLHRVLITRPSLR
ncbi:DUF2437 domain-containing protein [Bradyrhizobium septentrionale]|uniref:Rv2993c-like domain-containing protein n=1 Tax=Bradyrhizobium septentrionale TaxID=1404411 RepID=A0ABZ2P4W5_9BRAD